MAFFLSLVAGVVIGLIGGWLLRGLRTPNAPDETSAESTPTPGPDIARALEAPATESDLTLESEAEPAEPQAETVEAMVDTHPADHVVPTQASSPESSPEPVAADSSPVAAPALQVPAQPATGRPAGLTEPVALVADLFTEPEPVGTAAKAGAPVAVADNLTKIPGIGPKAAAALAAAGITTYRRLAASDTPTLRAAITAAGMRPSATVSTWPEHAKQLDSAG